MSDALYMIALAILLVIVASLSGCKTPAVIDRGPGAQESGDATAILSGCGAQPVVGYVYCRKTEGEATARDEVRVHAPKGSCKRDACSFALFFYPTGEPALSVTVPKDGTMTAVPLSALTKKDRFDKGDRGFWPVLVKTYWQNGDGDERVTLQEGEVRLRVMAAGYVPLHEVARDPAYGWEWADGQKVFRMTTAGRAYVGAP